MVGMCGSGGKPALFCLGIVDLYFSRPSSGVLSFTERRASALGILGSLRKQKYSLTSLPSAQGTGMTPAPQPKQTCLATWGPGSWAPRSEVPASTRISRAHRPKPCSLVIVPLLTRSVFHLLLCAGTASAVPDGVAFKDS